MKKSFSAREVIGLLTAVMVFVAMISYAGINIPYSFQAGTVARSSEVNANFRAIADAMPAVKRVYLDDSGTFQMNCDLNNAKNITSITITPPAPTGFVMVQATGFAALSGHRQGVDQGLVLQLSQSAGAVSETSTNAAMFELAASHPDEYCDQQYGCHDDARVPFAITELFQVTSTDPITVYLNGGVTPGTSCSVQGRVMATNLVALYFPAELQ